MASTIQLRTGTGSAVPSALTQGEVAINVTNGLVYYGSGSGNDVKQLESFTHVTASGNISASGDITANSFVGNLTGQAATVATIAGLAPNTATTQATQAAITTAANLTTVGALNAGSITSGFTSIDVGAGAITTTGTVSAEHVLSSDDIVAQGDISASGTITGNVGQFNQINIDGEVALDTGDSATTGRVFLDSQITKIQIGKAGAVTQTVIEGNITASGNISASGRIYGRQFEQIETNFSENFGSRGVVYMPFSNQSISDNTNPSNINVNRVAAVPGKPVKSVIRAVSNTLGNNAQYTMSYWEAAAGDPTNPILKSAAYAITDADSNKDAIIFDFTSPNSGSTTDVAVGSRIWMTLEAEGTGNGSFIVTHVWEWDYNSIM